MPPLVHRRRVGSGARQLEFLYIANMSHCFAVHLHRHDILGLVRAGRRRIECPDQAREYGPGDLFFLPAGVPHRIVDQEATVQEILFFRRAWPMPTARPRPIQPPPAAMAALVEAVWRGAPGYDPLRAFALLLSDLDLPAAEQHPPLDRPVQRALDTLLRQTETPVSTTSLIRASGLSYWHIHRLFRRQVGVPPHALHLQRRVFRAAELLASGVSPAAVAGQCGFCDQSHLNRVFRRTMGVTPRCWRER